MTGRLLARLYTRQCRGCDDTSFHTHHLTRLGRAHYARISRPRRSLTFWLVLSWAYVVIGIGGIVRGAVTSDSFMVGVGVVELVMAYVCACADRRERRRRRAVR